MKVFRLPALALAVSSLLATAWALGVGACSDPSTLIDPNCLVPTPTETGADGGPDPCHCNLPGEFAASSCLCTSNEPSGVNGLTWAQTYHLCMDQLPPDAGDAAEGGPIPASACDGQCWPPPPYEWMMPLLLWTGAEADAPQCPPAAPWTYYNGYSGNTFALGCTGGSSGACPVPGEVCAPTFVAGFSQCVIREGVVPCPIVGNPMSGEYSEEQVFYEIPGQPLVPSTFCCLAAPLTQ